jgi:MFS family permease
MRRNWHQTFTIAAVVGLAKADAASMGVVAPALRSHLHISDAGIGLLASLAAGTGALCALPAGTLVDRRHRVAVVCIAAVGWSLGLGLAGFATGFLLLAIARVASGGVATIARPLAVSLSSDLSHPDDRGWVLATLDSGQAVGTAVCFVLGAVALRWLDWRWLFWLLAAAGFLLAAAASRLPEPFANRPAGPPILGVLRMLLTIRTNLVVLVADSVGNFFFAGAASFTVLFISSRYGLSNATVDALAPVMAVGVIVGILAGGRLGDRLTRAHGGQRRLLVAASCQLVATLLFGLALLSGSVYISGAVLFLAAGVLGGAGPCLDAVRVDIVPSSIRGRAEAARGLLMLGSAALGPVTFGLVATAFGGRGGGTALRNAFMVMLVPLAAGAVILLAAVRPYPYDAAVAAGRTPPEAGPSGHQVAGRPGPGILEA